MPIQVVWDNEERTIICYVIEGNWTWDEMQAAVATSNAMLDASDHAVHFIYDMQQSKGVPNGSLTQLRRFIGKEHPKTGQSVLVSGEKSTMLHFAKGLLSMVHKIYKRDWGFQFADSPDAAREMLTRSSQSSDVS